MSMSKKTSNTLRTKMLQLNKERFSSQWQKTSYVRQLDYDSHRQWIPNWWSGQVTALLPKLLQWTHSYQFRFVQQKFHCKYIRDLYKSVSFSPSYQISNFSHFWLTATVEVQD